MFRVLGVTIITVLVARCGDRPERTLGIFLKFDALPGKVPLQEMKDEVARILKPAGISVYWRSLEESRGTESFSNIAVFQFRGVCNIQPPAEIGGGREFTLATTAVADGEVLPFSEVACDEVAHVLPSTLGDRQKIFGKILGRVMVHELFHSLAKATRHTSRGIRKSTFAAIDLAWGTLHLNEAEMRSLLARSAK